MPESLPEHEVPFLPKDHNFIPASKAAEKKASRRTLLFVAVISAIVSTIATVSLHSFLLAHSTTSLKTSSLGLESLPYLSVPPLGNVLRTYIPEPQYVAQSLNESHDAWMSLFPKGMGYVSMEKIESEGPVPQIVQDMSTDGSGRFCVAGFHQLHCLYLIYADFRRALSGDIQQSDMHTLHCFDYLRESIICAADSALEPFRSPFDGGTGGDGIDGFGSLHQCRDFKQLFQWSERFRYNDEHDAEKFEG